MQTTPTAPKDKLSYAIMNDDSMQNERPGFPGIKKGDLITIDCGVSPQEKDIVIVKRTDTPDFIVRRLRSVEDSSVYLESETEGSPVMEIPRRKILAMYRVVSVTNSFSFVTN